MWPMRGQSSRSTPTTKPLCTGQHIDSQILSVHTWLLSSKACPATHFNARMYTLCKWRQLPLAMLSCQICVDLHSHCLVCDPCTFIWHMLHGCRQKYCFKQNPFLCFALSHVCQNQAGHSNMLQHHQHPQATPCHTRTTTNPCRSNHVNGGSVSEQTRLLKDSCLVIISIQQDLWPN